MRLHAALVAGGPDTTTARADADFCFDFAHGLVRLLDSSSSSTTRIRMGIFGLRWTRCCRTTAPNLVDLDASVSLGRTSLGHDTSSNSQAARASPQPTYGCTFSGPHVVGGPKVNAVLSEPDPPPPSRLWEQRGPSAWLPPSCSTPARAPPSSGQDAAPVPSVGWGFAVQKFAPSSGSGCEDPAGHLAVSEWRTRINQ
jgi:hypothetical protein